MKVTIQCFDLNGIRSISFKPRLSKKLAKKIFESIEHAVEKHVYAVQQKDLGVLKTRLNNEFADVLFDETPFLYNRYFEKKREFVPREFDATRLPNAISGKGFAYQIEDIEKIVKLGKCFVAHEYVLKKKLRQTVYYSKTVCFF